MQAVKASKREMPHLAQPHQHTAAHHGGQVHDAHSCCLLNDGVAVLPRPAAQCCPQQRTKSPRLQQLCAKWADEAGVTASAQRVAREEGEGGAGGGAHVGSMGEAGIVFNLLFDSVVLLF